MDYVAMGARIRAYRKQRGMTQASLAESVGISTSFIGHIERGTRITSLETLVSLSNVLDISIDTIITGVDTNQSNNVDASYKMRVLNDVMRILNEHSNEWLRED